MQANNAQDELRQRWQALAEQLGLPPDPEPELEAVPKAPAVRVTPPTPREEPIAAAQLEQPSRLVEPESLPPETGAARGRRKRPSALPEMETAPHPAEPEPATETVMSAEPAEVAEAVEEASPERGRRRGRRGGRTPAPAAEAETITEEPAAEEPAGEEPIAEEAQTDRGRRRGRGRGRSRKSGRGERDEVGAVEERVSKEQPAVETEAEDEPQAEREEPDVDEEAEPLSDLNVPSWQELIGSLYRPDR